MQVPSLVGTFCKKDCELFFLQSDFISQLRKCICLLELADLPQFALDGLSLDETCQPLEDKATLDPEISVKRAHGDPNRAHDGRLKRSRARELPQTAQVAAQQGAYAARLLNRGYDLAAVPTPVFQNPQGLDTVLLPLVQGLKVNYH